jgi:hypothetical protein
VDFVLPLLLAQALFDHAAFQWREVVDKDLAVKMIDLVLNTHRQQAVGIQLERLPSSPSARPTFSARSTSA